jgi:hypothetical protein
MAVNVTQAAPSSAMYFVVNGELMHLSAEHIARSDLLRDAPPGPMAVDFPAEIVQTWRDRHGWGVMTLHEVLSVAKVRR